MEQEHKDKLNDLTHEVIEVKEEVQGLVSKINIISAALIGSDIGKDGGLVERIESLEDIAKKLGERVDVMEKKTFTVGFYLKIIWWLVGVITSGFGIFIIQSIIKGKQK